MDHGKWFALAVLVADCIFEVGLLEHCLDLQICCCRGVLRNERCFRESLQW
jgi:hypothetical protein